MSKKIKHMGYLTSFLCFFLIFIIPTHQVLAWDSSQSWQSQATGCNAVSGNIDATINNVYLGIGSTVPQSILDQYPQASSSFLEAWKTNMVGMNASQFKSFIIPADQGYTTPGAQLFGKDLFFEVTILKILNDNGTHITSRDSVVNVEYSLFTDCQVSTSSSTIITTNTSTPLSTTTSFFPSSTSSIENTTIQTVGSTFNSNSTIKTTPGGLMEYTMVIIILLAFYRRLKQ